MSLVVDAEVRSRLPPARRQRLRRRLQRMVRAAALAEGTKRGFEVALRLTGDETIRVLNRDYRHKNRPTDVLSFAQREGEGGDLHPEILGDIVISVATAARQARRGLDRELIFLAAHGLCHLLGYDHRTDAEDAVMTARVRRLVAEAAGRGPTRPA